MIKCEGSKLEVRGELGTTIGPELVQIIGGIYDYIKATDGQDAAEGFIDICVTSALLRMPEEMKAAIDEQAKQMENMTEDEVLKHFGFCQ